MYKINSYGENFDTFFFVDNIMLEWDYTKIGHG